MSGLNGTYSAPAVSVYALIGHHDCLLLLEYADHDALPGGAVRAGEPVERALRRTLLDQLGATIQALNFFAVIEHGTTAPEPLPASDVTFLFDVTLADLDRLDDWVPRQYRWEYDLQRSTLRPHAVRDTLIAHTISIEDPWRPWTP